MAIVLIIKTILTEVISNKYYIMIIINMRLDNAVKRIAQLCNTKETLFMKEIFSPGCDTLEECWNIDQAPWTNASIQFLVTANHKVLLFYG